MSALAGKEIEAASFAEVEEVCKIVVLCEDSAARNRSVEVFDRISGLLSDGLKFSIKCWNYSDLAEGAAAFDAAAAAANADIVMFSTRSGDYSAAVGAWLDKFPQTRQQTEGALAFLLCDPERPSATAAQMIQYLARTAQRLGMDFIPLLPASLEPNTSTDLPPSWTVAMTRKSLNDRPVYDHWGLNE